ncbi:MAG TPA: TonB family protein [Deltaproteobacteria bacterium]|nr:TonB family protein [Deltaproteobacteria bacterium]
MSPLLLWMALDASAQQPPAPEPTADPEAPLEDEGELPIVEGPAIVEYVEAPYPEEAKAQGLEAIVKLRIELTGEGEVDGIEVLEPAGHGFDEAAVDAVLAMTFSPARTAEGPVSVVFDFEYGFELRPGPTPPEPEAPPPVNLEGEVIEMATRDPIAGVTVVVDGTELSTETDADGRFELRGVPSGEIELRLLHTGHVTLTKEIEIVEGEITSAKLWMRSEAYRDNEVVAVYERAKDEVTRRTITIEEIRRVPGTFGDPIKVVQTLPGAARTPFGTGFLVIRGADPEDSGVYIDGIRVPIIYHLTGTTSVLSPDLIESVDYLPGGYGVRYGRTMGGTVNVNTKRAFEEDGKLVWGTDILDSQVYYEGRLGRDKRQGLAVGARRSYIDLFIPLFLGESQFVFKPRYWDYQLKWVPELDATRDLSLFVYGSDDLLRVETPADVAQGSDRDTQGNLQVRYSSHRIIGRWHEAITDDLELEVIPSVGIDGTTTGLGDDFTIQSTNVLPQVRAELSWRPLPVLEIVPGTDLLGGWYGFDFRSAASFEQLGDPLAEREPVGFDGSGTFWSPDPYLRLNLRPFEGSDRWLVSPGVRYNLVYFTTNGGITGEEEVPPAFNQSVDLRVLSRYQLVPDKLALKGATGLYHQPPQPQESIGVGTASTVGFERSWSTTLGWEQRLTQAIQYDVDLFYRKMDNLVVFDESFTGLGTNPFVNGGDGRAYGMEIMARHDPVGRFFGWVSYTLSRATRRDPFECVEDDQPENLLLGNGPCWYPFDFDQTHIFSAQAGYDLPRDFGISAQVQYVSGNPSSVFNAGIYDADSDVYSGFRVGQLNDDRMPPYFQTSLRLDRLWTFKRWQLETYVDLLNAVRGINPEFTIYNYDYSEFAFVRGLPFIPNIGLEAKFYP